MEIMNDVIISKDESQVVRFIIQMCSKRETNDEQICNRCLLHEPCIRLYSKVSDLNKLEV